jgi:hypothetical protein
MNDKTSPLQAVRVEPVVGRHDDPEYSEAEKHALDTLAMLKMQYEKAAQPYIDMLAMIRGSRPPRIIVSAEQARDLGLTPNGPLEPRAD